MRQGRGRDGYIFHPRYPCHPRLNFSVTPDVNFARGPQKEIAAAANTRSRGGKSIQSEKRALRIRRARDGLWPSRQVDNQSNDRNQPAQDHNQCPIR